MKKSWMKLITIVLSISLLLGLVSSFTLAAKEELTPVEWGKLKLDEKLAYKTIVIRCGRAASWMEEGLAADFIENTVHGGNLTKALELYNKTLFELAYPNVRIVGVDTSIKNMEEIMTGIAGRTGSSFFLQTEIQSMIDEDLCADITDLVEEWEMTPWLRETYWGEWSRAWRDGRCYGIPWAVIPGTFGISYRKDWMRDAGIFDEAGRPGPSWDWTFEDFRQIAVKLTDTKKNRWGSVYNINMDRKNQQLGFDLAFAFGALMPWNFIVPDKSGKYTWRFEATPQVVEAMQYIKDLKWKYDCILTGTEVTHKNIRSEFWAERSGMCWFDSGYLYAYNYDTVFDGIPVQDAIGYAPKPVGIYGLTAFNSMGSLVPFDPTLNKEELKAAFDWLTWQQAGQGLILRMNQDIAKMKMGYPFPAFYYKQYPVPLAPDYPDLRAIWNEKAPRCLEWREHAESLPVQPDPSEYGLMFGRCVTKAEEITVLTGLWQGLISDPNFDIEAELKKVGNILNSTLYNVKIEGDTEKVKAFFTDLANFYKENYPEFYQSDVFQKQYETYFRL